MRGWAALLHNDDVSDVEFVARSVAMVARLPPAELYQERFKSLGLTVTIEPAR